MGYNSLLFIPNDQLSSIGRNPDGFAWELSAAINLSAVRKGSTPLGREFSSFSIPYCAHADGVGLVAVGGNYAEKIYQGFKSGGPGHDHHTPEGKVDLLKRLAGELGYSVRKKK